MPGKELVPSGGQKRQGGHDPRTRRLVGEEILAARIRGEQMHLVAAEHGISEATAYRWMDLAVHSRIAPTVDEFRARENELLDATQRQLQENLDAANFLIRQGLADEEKPKLGLIERGMNARMQAVQLQLRLAERRAKLNGLDAPVQVQVEHTQIDPREAELAEMVREAKAKLAAEGQQS